MRILKYSLEITDRQTIQMPDFAKILTVQIQNGIPQLWALVDEAHPRVNRIIRTYGTGRSIDRPISKYIGTYQTDRFIFHVFDETE